MEALVVDVEEVNSDIWGAAEETIDLICIEERGDDDKVRDGRGDRVEKTLSLTATVSLKTDGGSKPDGPPSSSILHSGLTPLDCSTLEGGRGVRVGRPEVATLKGRGGMAPMSSPLLGGEGEWVVAAAAAARLPPKGGEAARRGPPVAVPEVPSPWSSTQSEPKNSSNTSSLTVLLQACTSGCGGAPLALPAPAPPPAAENPFTPLAMEAMFRSEVANPVGGGGGPFWWFPMAGHSKEFTMF